MARTIRLRPWQKAALDAFAAVDAGTDRADFLAVATPGAGKTTFALVAARHWLARHPLERVVVVAPTQHLKRQWARNAAQLDLHLEPEWRAGVPIAADMDGIVTTYQQVASNPRALAGVSMGGFVVLDEVHHAGEDRAWGDALRAAFEAAGFRLSLSGTPFRSDTNPIPFVNYEWEEAVPDYEYGYGDALDDGGVVRPVHFPRIKGHMEWVAPDGSLLSHDFDDELDRVRANQRLRTALSAEGQWLSTVLDDAHRRLDDVRETHPTAGGLVIAMDVEHAHAIADLLQQRWRVRPTVAVSDDPAASAKIAAFADSESPWIVAVRMVSEGVDIPRLRVGVFATNTTTELFFRQALGRLVRWTRGVRQQKAWLYIPDDPRLRRLADGVTEQRRHSLFKKQRSALDPDEPIGSAELDPFGEDDQLSLFAPMSAVVTGVDEGAVATATPVDVLADWEPADDSAFEIDLPPVRRRRLAEPGAPSTEPGADPDRPVLSRAEHKAKLRQDNRQMVQHLVAVTGRSHREVNAELNRRSGVRKVDEATSGDLLRRLTAGRRWVHEL